MYFDRIRDTTTSTGTGTITVSGTPPTRFVSYGTLPLGLLVDYGIESQDDDEFEIGRGRILAGNQLSRDEVHVSSVGVSLVDFAAGTKDVFLTVAARSVMTKGKVQALPYAA